jgi:transcription-repair coupling factor (superfamily II helicase)
LDAEAYVVSRKDTISPEKLRRILVELSYENMNLSLVQNPGQFSIRGSIVDIWLERYLDPVRIDFFGDRVEAVYLFDPLHHQPKRTLQKITIFRYQFTKVRVLWPKDAVTKFERLLLSDIKPGDLVVHIDHGIGRFLRVEERNLEGRARYYLLVEYAKGEKLYVPVQQIDRLSKYIGVRGYRPQLNYLGTQAWERTKKTVSQDLIKVARELLKLYAARNSKTRFPYDEDSSWQKELEDAAPFELTPSQSVALSEIKLDLQSQRPMDRLLVGDVGFGKTELALRASFKVVEGGRQVIILVPTTILAEQHHFNFKERLKKFPIRVEKLSRLQDRDEQERVLAGLESGEVDIVIATHRVLGSGQPAKLGLLVIDEEHRFGVLQKEHFKKFRQEIDVLSLSATPIPRTLYQALTKLRDVSTLSDPIPGRKPVQNFIGPFNPDLVRGAIQTELKRSGQVYYLHNRVQSIVHEAERLARIVPEARIAIAHGEMDEHKIEETMLKFLNREFDVLVCTTIIGSGLDLPNVNTILIKDSQKLGLADLYQLRGRVGRGEREGYAYFFYPKGYIPKGNSRERLEGVAEFSALGSGFNLAQRDLEIRGAGNLLGVEQHGNVSLVGFELYLQLLNRAVETIR